MFGFIEQSRYLPDRRDLNRSFPGSPRGSLAARLADLFMKQVVSRCTHGIDLHTAADSRTNLPQIRANLKDPETERCARAFGAPAMIHASTRDGSLREAATKRGIAVLLYEGGEALRFNPDAIEVGVQGILRVMAMLEMYQSPIEPPPKPSLSVAKSQWVRASRSGILRLQIKLGQQVEKKQSLGAIADPFGETTSHMYAPCKGLVIGYSQNPLVNQGDAIVHLAILHSQ